ncbi:MAG: sigma 54-interacting transcriptional regulator [Planctomycetaceae bacterium]|nr:sigma 54-interacting transcriptional regulator [Planctomycetaceae bacterium]
MTADRPQTLRELKESGYQSRTVKQEMRTNLLQFLREGKTPFTGILGYEETVLPQVYNGILSQHDMLFLGLRGQGKTRMLRQLVNLLDEWMPVVAGSEIHDDPLNPLSKYGRDLIVDKGDDTPIDWVGRDDRYYEKLATPDVTIADLIGEVDLIKHAEGRHLASEDVMHFGLIPRSHRGIFCMNELPDLSPKIQVGLFNVLEERDIQIRGFPIRLELDLCLVFSANPEDYTNRGRIVTPLKDRIGSVVRTHYPLTRELGIQITQDNAWTDRDAEIDVRVPKFMQEIVEEIARLARTSPHVNQASGVSVRMSIANYENMLSNGERRAAVQGQSATVARPADLSYLTSSARGKMELTMSEEPGEEDELVRRIMDEAISVIFGASLSPKQFRNVVEYLDTGNTLDLSDRQSTSEALSSFEQIPQFRQQLETVAEELEPEIFQSPEKDELLVAVGEFILHGLYAANRINRQISSGGIQFG